MTYGVRMYNVGGDLRLDTDESFTRLVHVESLAPLFTGTFSVPGFDDTRGFFSTSYSILETSTVNASNPNAIPTLNWNNTTKVMTVGLNVLPVGWEGSTVIDPAYEISFYHYG